AARVRVEETQADADDFRFRFSAAQYRRSAGPAEASLLPRRGLELRQGVRTGRQPKVLGTNRRIRHERTALRLAALDAMAVADRANLPVDLVANCTAQAASGQHRTLLSRLTLIASSGCPVCVCPSLHADGLEKGRVLLFQ